MQGDSRRDGERGLALVMTLLLLMMFLTLGGFALQFSAVDAKIALNHTTGTRALDVAESGLLHAMATINRIGVTDFDADIVQRWNILFSPNPKSFPNNPQLTYQVQLAAGADPVNTGTITVTANGTSRSKRVVIAQVRRSVIPNGRGALFLAADSLSPTFSGTAFEIDGNDHDLAGTVLGGGAAKPGIAVRNDTVANAVKDKLNNNQIPSVQGLGYSASPLTPSVLPSGGPSVDDLNQIINDLLARPGVQTVNDSNIAGGTTFGDLNHPQITHLTNNNVTLAGHVSGAGILIADGSITISGNTDFTGWIIVRGQTVINASSDDDDDTVVLGNANILGALWTADINVKVGGSAIIDYSSAALTIADQITDGGSPVPKPMAMMSWAEVF